jgi:hypothetical protein
VDGRRAWGETNTGNPTAVGNKLALYLVFHAGPENAARKPRDIRREGFYEIMTPSHNVNKWRKKHTMRAPRSTERSESEILEM